MNRFWSIVRKEIRDNLRDKRTLFFALLYGPLLMPALMIGPMIFAVQNNSIDFERPQTIAVHGAEHAPNLLAFLKTRNLDTQPAPENYRERIRDNELELVLEIPPAFAEAFVAGEPAPLVLHFHSGEDGSRNLHRRVKSALDSYHNRTRSLRFLARGVDESIFTPLSISERDLSRDGSSVEIMGLILPFMLLFSMMMGGFYLAVDSTAGERERLSLEPLLGLPVRRSTLVLGKCTAILLFVLTAMVLPLVTSFLMFGFIEDEAFKSAFDFSASTFLIAGAIHLPIALLITALLFTIAALTRSTKEAQTHLGIAMLVPIMPFFALQYLNLPPGGLQTMWVPMLSQYQIMERVVAGDSLPTEFYAISAAGALLLTVALLILSIRLYSKERLLQS